MKKLSVKMLWKIWMLFRLDIDLSAAEIELIGVDDKEFIIRNASA